MQCCPVCGKNAEFTLATNLRYAGDVPYYQVAGRCSECKALVDPEDLDRAANEERPPDPGKVLAAKCPVCTFEAPNVAGYIPAIELMHAVCGHYGCKTCVDRCHGCLRLWCDDCLYLCLDCGTPVCPECAIGEEGRMFHAACVPIGARKE